MAGVDISILVFVCYIMLLHESFGDMHSCPQSRSIPNSALDIVGVVIAL